MKSPLPASEKPAGSAPSRQDAPAIHNNYRAFLVRLWRDSSRSAWRASLQDAVTGQRQAFSGVEGLIGFLLDQVGGSDAPADATPTKDDKR